MNAFRLFRVCLHGKRNPLTLLAGGYLLIALNALASVDSVPIDRLEAQLTKTYSSKNARNLKKAYEALEKQNYTTVFKLLSKSKTDSTFVDFENWIKALASQSQARAFFDKKKYSLAVKPLNVSLSSLTEIQQKYPYSPFIKLYPKQMYEAEIALGSAYWGIKQWKKSEEYFERGFIRLQAESRWNDLTEGDIARYAEACKKKTSTLCLPWLRKLMASAPKRLAPSDIIGRYFPELDPTPKGRSFRISQRVSVPYKAPDLDQVAFDSCMQLELADKPKDAMKCFQVFLDDFPRSTHIYRARYWLAQSHTKRENKEEAQKLYQDLLKEGPMTYYGLLSSFNLGQTPAQSAPLKPNYPMANDSDTQMKPQDIYHLERARNLLAEKAAYLASVELKEIPIREDFSTPFLIYLAMLNSKAKNHQSCFLIIKELSLRGYDIQSSPFLIQTLFPLEFIGLIQNHAKQHELDPAMILSLIKQESAFTQDANSSVGAQGLMQLMPTTALAMEEALVLTELRKPEHNIRIGTLYLKKLIKQYHGNLVYALAAYNAGPTAVERWIKGSSDKWSTQEFIESITYKETREYVSSILRNYYWYSKLLNGGFTDPLVLLAAPHNLGIAKTEK